MIPKTLIDVENFLSTKNIDLARQGTDTRSDSAYAETQIINVLNNEQRKQGWNIYSPNIGKKTNRSWYDVKIDNYFCDIKVTELKTADNTNAKKAIYYFLTGDDEVDVSNVESSIFEQMKANEKPCEKRDYYYIVINKTKPTDVFVVSLKHIAAIIVSSNNPPFQCRWDDCRTLFRRNWEEARDFLLKHWAQSIERKILNTQAGMLTHYPEFFSSR